MFKELAQQLDSLRQKTLVCVILNLGVAYIGSIIRRLSISPSLWG